MTSSRGFRPHGEIEQAEAEHFSGGVVSSYRHHHQLMDEINVA
jgi:hypothetical protein